jgi:hypothetical protein
MVQPLQFPHVKEECSTLNGNVQYNADSKNELSILQTLKENVNKYHNILNFVKNLKH